MKNNNENGRLVHFLRRNGVYIALAISIIAVGSVLVAGLSRRLTKTNENSSLNAQQQVEQKVTGQKDTRTSVSVTAVSRETQKQTTTSVKEMPHLYLLPLTNTVQKPYSAEGPQYCKTMNDWRLHLGVDFAGEVGQRVKSVTRGTVRAVKNDPLWGGIVEIDHGVGVITRYCGVQANVAVGDKVDMGGFIGTLQTIPCECAQSAHLHLEMIVDGTPIDPVAAIALEVRYAETTD